MKHDLQTSGPAGRNPGPMVASVVASLATVTVACLIAPPLLAVDSGLDPWMTDRYRIEVIVFRHLDQSRNTAEQPAATSLIRSSPLDLYPQPDVVPAGPYADPAAQAALPGDRVMPPAVGFYLLDLEPAFPDFVPLNNDAGELGDVYARLERLDAYHPILHRTWMQAAQPADAAVPLQISTDTADAFSLTGSVTLYKERYVHLEVDLDLAAVPPELPSPDPEPAPWPEFGDVFAPPDPGQVPLQAPDTPAYELRESRRIRGVNAQYFDNPQFGVIARVTEIDLSDESED